MRREANHTTTSNHVPHSRNAKVILAYVHTVRAGEPADIRPIIHHERAALLADGQAQRLRSVEEFERWRRLVAVLKHTGPCI